MAAIVAAPESQSGPDHGVTVLEPAILLHHHGVGTGGHRGAGEDAQGLAGANRAVKG